MTIQPVVLQKKEFWREFFDQVFWAKNILDKNKNEFTISLP